MNIQFNKPILIAGAAATVTGIIATQAPSVASTIMRTFIKDCFVDFDIYQPVQSYSNSWLCLVTQSPYLATGSLMFNLAMSGAIYMAAQRVVPAVANLFAPAPAPLYSAEEMMPCR